MGTGNSTSSHEGTSPTMQCGPLWKGSRALSSPALTLSLESARHAGPGPRGPQGSLLPAHSSCVYLCFFAEGHAKTSFSLCPLPPYLVHCFMCAVGLLGLLPPPLHICVLSSRSSVRPAGRAEFWAGSTSAQCPPHPCLLSPGPGTEAEMRGQHPPEFTVHCPQTCSWLSKVRPYASQPSGMLPLCLLQVLLALAPCCPQGLCLPLPRSLWDPGSAESRLCRRAPVVWPHLLCNLL